jgi:hypothetical protein
VKRSPLLLLLLCSTAHADERATTIAVAGMAGAFNGANRTVMTGDYYVRQPEGTFGPRLTLSWEHAPLAMPDARGYRFEGALVPELVAGAFLDDVRAQGFIGAGLRAELRIAQREMGLLRMSARGAVYVAARGMVVGEERKPFGEFAIGEYLLIGSATRIGFEADILMGRADQMYDEPEPNIGVLMQFYVGWQL